MKIAVLGAGMVGRTIAADLSANFDTTSFDISQSNLLLLEKFPKVKTTISDLSNFDGYTSLLDGYFFFFARCTDIGYIG